MATSIGSIVVDLQANTAQFRKDLASASGTASQAASGIQGAFRSIGTSLTGAVAAMVSFRAVIGTVAGTAGLGLMVKNALSAGEEIVNMAQRVGVSTNALQELSHAARSSGASVDDLEQGLTILNRRLGEAQAGEKSAIEAFRLIGVDPTKFRDAGAAIGAVSDGLLSLGSEAQRTASQLDLLGRGSGKLTGLVKEGSEGIARLSAAAHDLGLVIDLQVLEQSKKLSDQLTVLSEVAKANLMKVLIDLGPILVGIAEKMAAVSREARAMFEFFFVPDAAITSLDKLNDRIAQVNRAMAETRERIAGAPPGTMAADEALLKSLQARKTALEALAETQRAYNRAIEQKPKTDLTISLSRAEIDAVNEFARKLERLKLPEGLDRQLFDVRVEVDKLMADSPRQGGRIKAIANEMAEVLKQQAAAEVLKEINKGIVAAIEANIDEYESELKAIEQIDDAQAAANRALEDQGTAGLIAAIEANIDEYQAELKKIEEVQDAQAAANKAMEDQGNAGLIAAIDANIQEYEDELRSIEKVQDAQRSAREANDQVATSLQDQIKMFGMTDRAAAQYAATLRLGSDALPEQIARTRELAGALFDLVEKQRIYNGIQQIAISGATQLGDAIYDFATGADKDFGEAVKRIIASINKMILAMIIAEIVARSLKAALGGVGGGGGDAGAGAAAAANVQMGGMASGGIVRARPGGVWKRLAEGGSDEAVIPLDRMNALGPQHSGPLVEVHIENNASGTTVEQKSSTGADGRQIERFIISTVEGGLNRGAFDNAGKGLGWRRQPAQR